MGEQATFQFTVDGRTIAAQPRPEDQSTLDELLGRGANVTVAQTDADTEGHAQADEISVDVEGHAMTLRLPNTADAQALRRALAVGALTATFAVGGFVAGTQVAAPAAPLAPPQSITITQAAPVAAPVQAADPQAAPAPNYNRQGSHPE